MILPALIIQGVLFLTLSEPREFPAKSSSVWFSKPDIVQGQALGERILLKPLKEGVVYASGLLSKNELQKIMVLSPANYSALRLCGAQFLEFSTEGFLLKNLSEKNLTSLKKCGFESLGLSPENQKAITPTLLNLEALLNKKGFRLFGSVWGPNGQREINVSQGSHKQLKEHLGIFSVLYKFNIQTKPRPGRTLIFESTLFEFSRTKARNLGFRFPENIKLWPLESGALETLSGTALALGLDFGEKEGVGKILARPKMRTKPGEKAIFQSGGEIPVKNENLHSSQTVWKAYGLQIEIEPDANLETGSPEISLSFKIEVSEPDFANAIAGVPSISMRKLQNRFDLRTNETTVLTSLIQLRRGNTKKGVPGLRSVPLFGGLFDNHSTTENESELYIALYPTWEEIL